MTLPLPTEAVPGIDDLEPSMHEPMDAPVSLKRPSAEYVILLVSQDAGVPWAIAKQWVCNLRFEDATL